MYIANARNLRLGPNQPLFHGLALGFCIGAKANFKICVGGYANFSVFICQHVGIANAKLWHWGFKPTPGPNANGFASQWNIGLTMMEMRLKSQCFPEGKGKFQA